jgi:membrane protein DedA with SNARE-associated domain
MEAFGHHLVQFITLHPDLAVFVIALTAFGESFAFLSLLFPGTAVLIAAGTLVSAHVLNPVPAALAGIAGAVVGDAISFWIGRKCGPVIPRLWPFRSHPKALADGMGFFQRYGAASVFIGRFFGPLRAVVPLVAGMMEMPTVPFYVANVVSALIWAPALLFSGVILGRIAGSGGSLEHRVVLLGLALGVAVVLFYGVRRLIGMRNG